MPPPILSAADYHRITSYDRLRMTPHHLDWAHQPRLDKSYPSLDSLALDRKPDVPTLNYRKLLDDAGRGTKTAFSPPDLKTITSLFYLTHTITARSMHGSQPFFYRSVASAGALYPFELYLAVHHIGGLAPGVYHYNLFDFSLNVLRHAPVPMIPPSASGMAAATVYVSGIFFRSAWKYRQRAFRYVLLDAGHLIENLRLALSALGLDFIFLLDFDDHDAGILLGLDPIREACVACVHILDGQAHQAPSPEVGDLAPLPVEIRRASRVSSEETRYEPIEQAYRAGGKENKTTGDSRDLGYGIGRLPTHWHPFSSTSSWQTPDYMDVLWQRRSRRNFVPAPIAEAQWAGFLEVIAAASKGAVSPLKGLTIGILVGDGVPVPVGFYLLDTVGRQVGHLSSGHLLESMATACLDQMWLKNAAFHLLFISDPAALDRDWGPRAYRHVMIEAGRLGQQAYLAAGALGLGACGIGAVYDREAADILDLPDDGALLYLVGVGPLKTR